jgi:release factor glutamine methyltransferase
MRIASNKIADIIRFFRNELNGLYNSNEIETLIAYCFEEYLQMKRSDIALSHKHTVTESELLKFNFAVKNLKQHKPIQYIFGKADFYGLKFNVNEHVLIPRPETEELVQIILMENGEQSNIQYPTSKTLLDIGTGSGCIPIALKKKKSALDIYALDIDEQALSVAKSNAVLNGVDITFFKYDILSSDELFPYRDLKFDIIVSNPPYICSSEKNKMDKNVLDYEPHLALFVDDENPLLFYNAICSFAIRYLKPNGKLYVEINQAYGNETLHLFEKKGFKNIILLTDLNMNNRFIKGQL